MPHSILTFDQDRHNRFPDLNTQVPVVRLLMSTSISVHQVPNPIIDAKSGCFGDVFSMDGQPLTVSCQRSKLLIEIVSLQVSKICALETMVIIYQVPLYFSICITSTIKVRLNNAATALLLVLVVGAVRNTRFHT
jgi:hypothetical protein